MPFFENGSGGLGSESTSGICSAIFSPESPGVEEKKGP